MSAAWSLLAVLISAPQWAEWREGITALWPDLALSIPWSVVSLGRAVGEHLAAAGGVAVMLAVAFGAGRPLVRWLGNPARGTAGAALALALGWSVPALVNHGLGLEGLFHGPLLILAALPFAVVGAPALVRDARRLWPARAEAWPVAVGGALLAVLFIAARLPHTHEDPMVYHFAAPEQYLALGRITPDLQNIMWRFPRGIEMLFAPAWAAAGMAGAKLVNIGLVVALALATGAWAGRLRPGAGAWGAALALAAGGLVNLCWQGKNDVGAAVFVTVAGWAMSEAVAGRRRWWGIAAWAAGAAVGARLTAGLTIVPLLLVGFAFGPRPGPAAVACLLAPCAGWFAENWAFGGNPFTPFLSGVFPDLAWDPDRQRALDRFARIVSGAGPFTWAEPVLGAWHALTEAGAAAPLVLLPFAVAGTRGRGPACLKGALAAAYLVWLPTERNGRFLAPAFPWILALAAAAELPPGPGAAWLGAARRVLLAAALPVAGLNLVRLAGPDGLLCLAGQRSPAAVLAGRLTTWDAARRCVNATVPARARVLLTGEVKRLWFTPRVISHGPMFIPPLWTLTRDAATPAELRKHLTQQGVTHLLHNFVEAEFRGVSWSPGPAWTARQLALAKAFLRAYARPVAPAPRADHANGGFVLYAIERAPAPRPWPLWFVPGTEGRLHALRERIPTMRPLWVLAEQRQLAEPLADVFEVQAGLAFTAWAALERAAAYAWLAPGVRAGFVTDRNVLLFALAATAAGRRDEAIHAFMRSARLYDDLSLHRELGPLWEDRAKERLAAGDARGALRDLDQALFWNPGDAEELGWRARALAKIRMR